MLNKALTILIITICIIYLFFIKVYHSRLICNHTNCKIHTLNLFNITLSTKTVDLSKIKSFKYRILYDIDEIADDIKKNRTFKYNKYYIIAVDENGKESKFFKNYSQYKKNGIEKFVNELNKALKTKPANIDITY